MKERKYKMKIPQLIIAILLTIALIALVGYGYYKQNQVIDKYEKYFSEDTNTVPNESVENDNIIEINSEIIAKLFPLDKIKFNDNTVLSYELLSFQTDDTTKKNFLRIGIKELLLNDIDVSDVKQTNTIKQTNTVENVTTQVTSQVSSLVSNLIDKKSEYVSRIVTLDPVIEQKDDKLVLKYSAVYLRELGETKKEDGTVTNMYICYARYNYQTDSYVGRLSDTVYASDLNTVLQAIDTSQLEKQTITYSIDQEKNTYNFSNFVVE